MGKKGTTLHSENPRKSVTKISCDRYWKIQDKFLNINCICTHRNIQLKNGVQATWTYASVQTLWMARSSSVQPTARSGSTQRENQWGSRQGLCAPRAFHPAHPAPWETTAAPELVGCSPLTSSPGSPERRLLPCPYRCASLSRMYFLACSPLKFQWTPKPWLQGIPGLLSGPRDRLCPTEHRHSHASPQLSQPTLCSKAIRPQHLHHYLNILTLVWRTGNIYFSD